MTTRELHQRLSADERDLALLKERQASGKKPHPVQVLEKIHGTFENDDAFQEAMRLGKKWRMSDRSSVRKSKARRK